VRDADACGAERAEHLVRDHREQRDRLDSIVARLDDATRPGDLECRKICAIRSARGS
jgi:hypothetical protein